MRMLILSTIIALSSISISQAEEYVVEADCTINGHKVTMPRVTVEAGKTASACATHCCYKIEMSVDAATSFNGGVAHLIDLKFSRVSNGKVTVLSEPRLMVTTGPKAVFAAGPLTANARVTKAQEFVAHGTFEIDGEEFELFDQVVLTAARSVSVTHRDRIYFATVSPSTTPGDAKERQHVIKLDSQCRDESPRGVRSSSVTVVEDAKARFYHADGIATFQIVRKD